MTDIERYVQNILRAYAFASDDDVRKGVSWYPLARRLATDMAPQAPLQAAGVIAIFSARTPWARNLMLAQTAFETGIAPGHMFTAHAQRMVDGESALSVLKGQKTRAFAQTIANGGRHDVTTIDGHAYDIADGKVWGKARPSISKGVYNAMDEAYHIAADITGYSNTEIQAITWVYHRRILGMDWRG